MNVIVDSINSPFKHMPGPPDSINNLECIELKKTYKILLFEPFQHVGYKCIINEQQKKNNTKLE